MQQNFQHNEAFLAVCCSGHHAGIIRNFRAEKESNTKNEEDYDTQPMQNKLSDKITF